jgi:large subunit ribosomal protein L31e
MPEEKKAKKEKESSTQGEEKIIIIPFRHLQVKSPKNSRMKRSVKEIRAFLAKHMRSEPSNVFISQQLNESLWKGGFHNTPSKIKIKVSTDKEGRIMARLMDEKAIPKKERKKPGLRERLSQRREGAKEAKPAEATPKAEQPKVPKPEEKPHQETGQAAPLNQ